MIGLMLALVTTPVAVPMGAPVTSPAPQAVSATLQSCDMEGGRWVCRYAVPDIEIVPIPGSDVVANAPGVVLGAAPTIEPGTDRTTVTDRRIPPVEAPLVPTPLEMPDAGALTEGEARLVARCADAGWMSLCLPDDRRAARSLRDKENAYLAVRREVTGLLARDRCEAAVRTALDGGYLALARQTREFCAASSQASVGATPRTDRTARAPDARTTPSVPRPVPSQD